MFFRTVMQECPYCRNVRGQPSQVKCDRPQTYRHRCGYEAGRWGARGDRRSGARPCRAQAPAWISSRLSMPLCTLVATFLRPLPAHRNMARREALQLGRLLKMEAEKTGQMVPGRC